MQPLVEDGFRPLGGMTSEKWPMSGRCRRVKCVTPEGNYRTVTSIPRIIGWC